MTTPDIPKQLRSLFTEFSCRNSYRLQKIHLIGNIIQKLPDLRMPLLLQHIFIPQPIIKSDNRVYIRQECSRSIQPAKNVQINGRSQKFQQPGRQRARLTTYCAKYFLNYLRSKYTYRKDLAFFFPFSNFCVMVTVKFTRRNNDLNVFYEL